MSTLYINSGTQDVLTKKDYLLAAANRLGIKNVLPYDPKAPAEFVLNVQPYKNHFVCGSVWTGAWEIDCLINKHEIKQHWEHCDTVFLANVTRELQEDNKHVLLYQACDPTLYPKDPPLPEFDFVLHGSVTDLYYYKDYQLTEPDVKADIYYERMRRVSLLKKKFTCNVVSKRLPIEKYIESLFLARVQFIQSMKVIDDEEVAQRFFECLPVGPVLTNYAPDLEKIGLVEGEDYLAYRTDTEMFEKMELLIKNENLRHYIVRNGRRKAFMSHTYEHRLVSILVFLRRYGF